MSAAFINLKDYPLDAPDSDHYRAVVLEHRNTLAETGLVNMEDFLRPGATAELVDEVNSLMPQAHYAARQDNPYGKTPTEDLPPDHPYRILNPTARYGIAYHQMRHCKLDALYQWAPLRQFVADVTGHERLYLHEDPCNALVLQIYKTGGGLAWHFDQVLFSTILNLSETEGGGVFECAPNIRSADDPCFDDVRDVLLERSTRVRQHHARAGSFTIIRGRYTLHRVTTIEGETPRISLILSYEDRPGVRMDVTTRKKLFGPTAPDDP